MKFSRTFLLLIISVPAGCIDANNHSETVEADSYCADTTIGFAWERNRVIPSHTIIINRENKLWLQVLEESETDAVPYPIEVSGQGSDVIVDAIVDNANFPSNTPLYLKLDKNSRNEELITVLDAARRLCFAQVIFVAGD